MDRKKISAAVLTGGNSTRMGRDKAMMPVRDGRTETPFLLKELEELCSFREILISAAGNRTYQDALAGYRDRFPDGAKVRIVIDEITGYGPLEGIRQILKHMSSDWGFLLAADMPNINQAVIASMLAELDRIEKEQPDCEILLPRAFGRIHPLCGMYRKSALGAVESLMEQNVHKVLELQNVASVHIFDLEERPEISQGLKNINTPEEYRREYGIANEEQSGDPEYLRRKKRRQNNLYQKAGKGFERGPDRSCGDQA